MEMGSLIGGRGSGADRELAALDYARVAMQRCDVLGGVSEEEGRLTRRFATPALREATEMVAGWMREAGMSVRQDNVGNLVSRYEGVGDQGSAASSVAQAKEPIPGPRPPAPAQPLLLGSHLDTVRDAGKYDGPLGVMIAIACVERLRDQGARLPFAVEVVAFADEEGLRFGTAYLGSKVFAGAFDPGYLDLKDKDGITVAQAIRDYGGNPNALKGDGRDGGDLLGYCEVHIEQGPVLEEMGLPVGVVSAIAGQTRFNVGFRGEGGHAGTVPMELRRDALCAAAEFVLEVEALARSRKELVATVGQVAVEPGASNVIPGRVTLSLDVRHKEDGEREQACGLLRERASHICAGREVALDWRELQSNPAVPCSPRLTGKLAQAVAACAYPVHHLPSGAGHDAVILSRLTEVAMLFVRCKGGISHNPAESVEVEDVAAAIEVLDRFVRDLP